MSLRSRSPPPAAQPSAWQKTQPHSKDISLVFSIPIFDSILQNLTLFNQFLLLIVTLKEFTIFHCILLIPVFWHWHLVWQSDRSTMEWFWRREREKEEERKMAGDMPFLLKDIGLFLVLSYFLFIYICIYTMLKLQILLMLD